MGPTNHLSRGPAHETLAEIGDQQGFAGAARLATLADVDLASEPTAENGGGVVTIRSHTSRNSPGAFVSGRTRQSPKPPISWAF